MRLPAARGPLSESLVRDLATRPGALRRDLEGAARLADAPDAVLTDEDLQLSLAICYELHYRGFDEVDDEWEWDPQLLGLRAAPRAAAPVGAAASSSGRSR